MFSLKRLLFLLFSILPFFGFSQKEAANWYFGDHAGVNFNTTPPSLLTEGQLFTKEGSASMSDADGNLLFYTDGVNIWNSNHQKMSNADATAGTGLMGDLHSTSSALIIPHPTDPDLYYVFTVDAAGPGAGGDTVYDGLNYSVVDMTLNNGLGNVVQGKRNIHLVTYSTDGGPLGLHIAEKVKCSEKLTGTRGEGCEEYWVMTRFINTFYAFKIDASGVHQTPVLSQVGPAVPYGNYDSNQDDSFPGSGDGYMKFSPDGSMLLAAHIGHPTEDLSVRTNSVYLYDFNKTTGKITNPIQIYNGGMPMYGVEFSLGSTKAYATNRMPSITPIHLLYQWDLESENIAASRYQFPNYNSRGTLQLAPNGKIYVATVLARRLFVINHPELSGAAADYSIDISNGAIDLGDGICYAGLPQFMPSLLFPWNRINIIDDSEDIKTKLSLCGFESYTLSYDETLPGTITYTWYKNEVIISGENSNSLIIEPPTPGTNLPFQVNYKLEVVQLNDGCTLRYRGIAKVTYQPKPEVFDVVLEQCQMENETTSIYNLNPIKDEIVGTAPVTDYTFEFFPSLSDAQNNDNQITNISAYYSSSNPQVLGVKITKNETGCFNFAEVTLIANQNGFNYPPIEISACDTNLNGVHFFNLTDALPEIINGNNQLEVHFYETMEQAYTEIGAIEDLFTFLNESSPYFQTIYARIEDNGVCSGIREIHLIIEESPPIGPDLTGENSLVYCLENLPEDITLSSGVPENQEQNFTFLWSPTGETTPTINTHELGEYTVTVTNIQTGCYSTRIINIVPGNMASFTLVHNDPSENNSITVVLSEDSIGDYEYALDDGPYQDSNIFEMVPAGLHTVYVRSKNGCGVSEKEIGIIGLMKFFTPNADGINDYWNIIGAIDGQQMLAELYIYDRYGKLLKTAYGRSLGWDGTYNGKKMPSNDYWYCIVLEDGKVLKGNFTLKR